MLSKIIQKLNKIISFFWKKKLFRYLAGGLVLLLLFNLVFPAIIKKEIVLANNQIQASEKTEALFVNNNPNFQIEFGNKNNSTENKIRFESLKGQNNPFQNSTTGEIQTQKEDQTLKEKIKKKLGEVQDKISPQKQGIEFKLKEVSTEEITNTPALQESTKQETSLNWKKNLLAFFLPNVQAEVLLQTEKQEDEKTEDQPQEILQEETDLLQTLQEELIQMTKDFSVDQSQSEKVFQAITQARTVFSQTQLKKEDNQDVIQNQEVAPNVDIEYQVLEGKGLKEDIIIKKRENFSQECLETLIQKTTETINSENCRLPQNTFTFALQLDQGVSFHQVLEGINGQKGGTYYFTDEQNNYLFHFLPLVANDASGAKTNDLILTIEEDENLQDNNYLLKVSLDLNWLLDNQRQFPVTIDPSIVHDTEVEFDLSSALNRVESIVGPEVQIQNPFGGNDQYTKLLLHGDGTDNSTTFSDSSMSSAQRKTITRNGDAKIEQDQSKFGGTSMYFDGTGDYLTIPTNTDFNFGTGNFTVDFWHYKSGAPQAYGRLFQTRNGDFHSGIGIDYMNSSTIGLRMSSTGSNFDVTDYGLSFAVSDNTWTHIALVRNGTTISLYKNGILVGSISSSASLYYNSSDSLIVGGQSGTDRSINGYLDELRISKGTARWTSNFTPPTRAYDGPKNYGVYNSPVIDSGDSGTDWETIAWTENGVQTGDGETPYSTDGLVAQWNFNETSGTTAVSGGSCGTSCDGTLTNMTTSGQDASTNSGWTANNGRWPKTSPAGLMFDGTDDYVDAGTWFNFQTFSISMWIKPGSMQTTYADIIENNHTASRSWTLQQNGSIVNQYYFGEYDGSSGINSINLQANVWQHLVITRDGNTRITKGYLNGVLIGSNTGTGDIVYDGTQRLGFARWYNDGSVQRFWNGQMDSVQIYNRALSANEILSNYNSGNLEIQTRTGNSTDPNDGTWEDWKPSGSGTETAVLNLDEDSESWEGKMDQYTKLLLHGDGTNGSTSFADKSLYTKTITPAGNAQISTAQSKFGGSAMYFDGTGDYLSVPDSDDFAFGSGDFTIDLWVRLNSLGVERTFFSQRSNTGVTGPQMLGVSASGRFYVIGSFEGSSWNLPYTEFGATATTGTWYHLALVRSGSSFVAYLNGIGTNIVTSTSSFFNPTNNFTIGAGGDSIQQNVDGYLDELRISKGIARWTSNFTPPNQAYHNPSWLPVEDSTQKIEGTGSLKVEQGKSQCGPNTVAYWTLDETGGSGAYLKDACGGNHGTPTGTTVTNAISGKARSFNGTSDYVSVPDSDSWNFGTGDFTIYGWFKFNQTTGTGQNMIVSQNVSPVWSIRQDQTNGRLYLYTSVGSYYTDNLALSPGVWYHIAFERVGSGARIFLNGQSINTVENVAFGTNDIGNSVAPLEIGRRSDGGSNYFNGTIDELRIVKGVSLSADEIAEDYRMGRDHRLSRSLDATDFSSKNKLPFYVASDRTGTFMETTMGESAFANYEPDANTVGLWHLEEQTGTGAYIKDSSNYGNHGTPTGTSFVEGKVGKGRSFNGTSDYVTTSLNIDNYPVLSFSAWIYPTATGYREVFGNDNGGFDRGLSSGHTASNNWYVLVGTDGADTGIATALNQWSYVTLVYASDNIHFYLNGKLVWSRGSAAVGYSGSTQMKIGRSDYSGGSAYFSGSLDEVRVDNIARTASEIRQAYEVGKRTHPITIDFSASLDSTNLITDSGDLSFTINSQTTGSPNKGDNLFNGDKIIIKENYDGTEYLAQGTVNSTNQSTGETTVTAWDTGSTFPSAGFTQNATVFKWQKEYWDLTGITDNQKNAINRMTLRVTDGSEARNIYLDDFKSSSSYLTNPTSSTISSSNNRYFQYRTIFSNNEQMSVSPVLSQISTTFRYQPTNNKLMRHGKWFKDNEQKSPGFFWAE